METKRCSKCGEVKELGEFSKDKGRKDGLNYCCRECTRESLRKWEQANPEKVKERNKKWRKANLEKVKEYGRKWIEANLDKVNQYNRKYTENCPDGYIKHILIKSGFPSDQITPKMIEINRKAILIKRQIKQIKNGL